MLRHLKCFTSVQVLDVLLRNPEFNLTRNLNNSNTWITLAMQSEPGVSSKPDSVKVDIVKRLLYGKELGTPDTFNDALCIADKQACKPVFDMLLRDMRVKMLLFFPKSNQIQTQCNRVKMLLTRFKHINKTAVMCFNRAWQRGMRVPNDVVRLIISEFCCVYIQV